ncbi:MAG: hypothetical protein KF726_20045 [Anaerolineae bacterium]|nr:hypothetical protein [Anaerolineae bacterium]
MIIKGFVRDISYVSQFAVPSLTAYSIADFDVNTARQAGLINLGGEGNYLAYARWISPKRTRSYPFARLYDTFHVSSPRVAIIPIIKDEGADSGNNDRINYMTFSWMSSFNIFIILVWYDAKRKVGDKHLITAQKIDPLYVREKLLELSQYRLSALHWNTSHFERDFSDIYQRAVESYQRPPRNIDCSLA